MSTDLRKTVLITGCTTGSIGEAIAKEFHTKGLRVFATSRVIDTMATLSAMSIETFSLDVTDTGSIVAARDSISKLTDGKLDILVNNAGIAYASAASDISMDRVKGLFDVNFFGAMEMVQEFIPLLISSGDGRILQMCSLAGLMPVPFNCAYNASKAALLAYGDTLRIELAPFNVKVINIAAGNVESNIMNGASTSLPPGSLYEPISAEFKELRIEKFQDGATPANRFATTVVGEALKTNPRAWLWTGNNSWTVWIIGTFLGRKGFDPVLSKMFGLTKLSAIKDAESKAATMV